MKIKNKYVTLNKRNYAFIPDTPQHFEDKQSVEKTSPPVYKKASITIETAIVLPLFLFAMIIILYINAIIQYTNCVEEGLHQVARDLAIKSYALSSLTDTTSNTNLSGKLIGVSLSETYVRNNVSQYLSKIDMKEGSISYLRSNFSNDIIDIIAEEHISLPFNIFGLSNFSLLERARVHSWTGYNGNEFTNSNIDPLDEFVYITKKGSVYHKNRGCYHLKVTPRPVSATDINKQRSLEGSKYYPCEYCGNKNNQNILYITDYGNRYHTSINCGAISRDIQTVKLSEVGNRRACHDCNN